MKLEDFIFVDEFVFDQAAISVEDHNPSDVSRNIDCLVKWSPYGMGKCKFFLTFDLELDTGLLIFLFAKNVLKVEHSDCRHFLIVR